MESKEIENCRRVIALFLDIPNTSGSSIAKSLNMHRQTVNCIFKLFKESSCKLGSEPGSDFSSLFQVFLKSLIKYKKTNGKSQYFGIF
jgi:hypothetical protein